MSVSAESLKAILSKLSRTRGLLERPWGENEATAKAMLQRRATELAQAEKDEAAREAEFVLLQFRLGHEHYGVAAQYVEKVMQGSSWVQLPSAPPHVLGVMNDNGETLVIFDFKSLLSVPESGLANEGKVVVLNHASSRLGFLAEEIEGIRSIRLAELQPPPVTLSSGRMPPLKGVTSEGLILLDGEKVLKDPGLIINQSA